MSEPHLRSQYARALLHREPRREPLALPVQRLSIEELLAHYRSEGVVGEELTLITATLCAVGKIPFGIHSASGSGKSYTLEKVIDILPSVYRMELSSPAAEIANADVINQAQYIFVPELQKAMASRNPIIVEALKNLTEGKDARRIVYRHGDIETQNISAGKGILFTLATENAFVYDAEFARRVIALHADESEQQTIDIIADKALRRAGTTRTAPSVMYVRGHMSAAIRDAAHEFINPYAPFIASVMPPLVKSRGQADMFFDLCDASAAFHGRSPVAGEHYVSLDDVSLVSEAYWPQFCEGVFGLPPGGRYLAESHRAGEKINAPLHALDMLVKSGFAVKEKGTYRRSERVLAIPYFDIEACADAGERFMRVNRTQQYAAWKEAMPNG